mgnify:CR=1 FL=1
MGVDDPLLIVDHIDGNIFNNRKSNLRVCTQEQNKLNRHKRNWSSTTSLYKWVFFSNYHNRWIWSITYKKKRRTKNFINEIDAARWYNAMATELFGDFACLNTIIE